MLTVSPSSATSLSDVWTAVRQQAARPWLRLVLYLGLLATAGWFGWQQRGEAHEVAASLRRADPLLVLFGALLSVGYVLQHGLMYRYCFRAANLPANLGATVRLFLQRNLLSVLLPAGGVSSLAFFTDLVAADPAARARAHVGSTVYAVTGIFSVLVVALPALLLAALPGHGGLTLTEWAATGLFVALNLGLMAVARSLLRRGWAYRLAARWLPDTAAVLDGLSQPGGLRRQEFLGALGVSVLIELTGIGHLLLAMMALGAPAHWEAATVSYVVATVLLVLSPVLRGAGFIELGLTYVLTRYGYPLAQALSITLLYRFFEFWLPLGLGMGAFVFRRNNLLLRLLPALAVGLLGLVNLVSGLTPAVPARLGWLLDWLPAGVVAVSHALTLAVGAALLFGAVFLLKGYRFAFHAVLAGALLSALAHLLKAVDYEEAVGALAVAASLWTTRRHYRRRGNRRAHWLGLGSALGLLVAALLYGVAVFWLLEPGHFGRDFSWRQALGETLRNFALLGWGGGALPRTPLAQGFVWSLHGLGLGALGLLLYSFAQRQYPPEPLASPERQAQARQLTATVGASSLDWFKTYYDKEIFCNAAETAFLAFREAHGYALALESPVAPDAATAQATLREFEAYCRRADLSALYYRVPETDLPLFEALGKKAFLIGQEAVLDVQAFSLEGRSRQPLRNARNAVLKRGYVVRTYEPPLRAGLVQKLGRVSDEWLRATGYQEIGFSQGAFDAAELSQQTILTLEDAEEKVVGFLNVLPPAPATGEWTFDLIRKTPDAPNGTIDTLLLALFELVKSRGGTAVNLGFVPLAGLDQSPDRAAQTLRFAADRLPALAHYHGLRDSKDKFGPAWQNRYLVYDAPYDLLQAPLVLQAAIKLPPRP